MKGYPIDKTVLAMQEVMVSGDVIPPQWYKHLRFDNDKPHLLAILILADIVYWYRPIETRDEITGQSLGLRKKFRGDKLQRDYQAFMDKFGVSKKQVRDAIGFLEQNKIIDKEFRNIVISGQPINNRLYLGIYPDELKKLTNENAVSRVLGNGDIEVNITIEGNTRPALEGNTGGDIEGKTNTENTTETTYKDKDSASFQLAPPLPSCLDIDLSKIQNEKPHNLIKPLSTLIALDGETWRPARLVKTTPKGLELVWADVEEPETKRFMAQSFNKVVYKNGDYWRIIPGQPSDPKRSPQEHALYDMLLEVTGREAETMRPDEHKKYWEAAESAASRGRTPEQFEQFKESFWLGSLHGWKIDRGEAVLSPSLDDIKRHWADFVAWGKTMKAVPATAKPAQNQDHLRNYQPSGDW